MTGLYSSTTGRLIYIKSKCVNGIWFNTDSLIGATTFCVIRPLGDTNASLVKLKLNISHSALSKSPVRPAQVTAQVLYLLLFCLRWPSKTVEVLSNAEKNRLWGSRLVHSGNLGVSPENRGCFHRGEYPQAGRERPTHEQSCTSCWEVRGLSWCPLWRRRGASAC